MLIIAGFVVWNLLPPAGLALLILVVGGRLPGGTIATVVGAVVYSAVTA